ncbi:MAG: DUF3048 domain-containing protein, partial [Cellulomonadaceae bacterium]|nr:DUF3048 domain-containing protein [Cellulomonadaceae bacterium]
MGISIRTLRPAWAVSVALLAGFALTGCASDTTPPAVTETVPGTISGDRTTPPDPNLPDGPPDKVWPLTGVATYQISEHPALVLKVENSNLARPQAGLEDADIVYEQVVEGGITRFVAIFDSHLPDLVYPVRSARGSDIGIVLPTGGIFGYSGANRVFLNQIDAAGIQSLTFDRGNRGFARISDRRAPHNISADPAVLLSQANGSRVAPVPAQQLFARNATESTMAAGEPANTISARMSNVQTTNWAWNPVIERYERYDGATPSMTVSGERLSATNVILLSVQMTVVPGITDASGARVPEVVLTGSGRAAFAAGGHYVEGTWVKGSNSEPFRF